jgi:predicted DNA-binding transcriptional regulator YafY
LDEALALIVSYEALMRYAVSPFSAEGVSAVTKLRAALPPDVVGELDALREHVAIVEPVHDYEAPLLKELLSAALDGAHLKVTYDSIRSGVSERVIFPFGVYASQGFWYCACYDHKREMNVALRADRFLRAERLGGPRASIWSPCSVESRSKGVAGPSWKPRYRVRRLTSTRPAC